MTRAEICNVPCGMAVVPVIQAWRYAFHGRGMEGWRLAILGSASALHGSLASQSMAEPLHSA